MAKSHRQKPSSPAAPRDESVASSEHGPETTVVPGSLLRATLGVFMTFFSGKNKMVYSFLNGL